MAKLTVVSNTDNRPNYAANQLAAAFDAMLTVDINSANNPTRFIEPIEYFMTMTNNGQAYALNGKRVNAKVFVYANDNNDTPIIEHSSFMGILSVDDLISKLAETINRVADQRLILNVVCYELYRLQVYVIAEYFASVYGDKHAVEFYNLMSIRAINDLNSGLPEPLESVNFDYDLEIVDI